MAKFKISEQKVGAASRFCDIYYNADFDISQQYVKKAEGGYQNIYSDAGNWTGGAIGSGSQIGTNWGISAPVLGEWIGRTATLSDMKNLTYAEALKIYKANYWDKIAGDRINNQSIATMLYDSAVNQGTDVPRSIIASVLSVSVTLPFSKDVTDKINNYKDQKELFNKIKAARKASYSTSSAWYSQYIKRVESIVYEAVSNPVLFVKENVLPLTIAFVLVGIGVLTVVYFVNKKQKS